MGMLEVALIILFFILGFIGGIMIEHDYRIAARTEAVWRKNSTNEWICVDITDVTPERALELCKHEVGHEIFAEKCEKDIDKCFEVWEWLE